MYRIINEIAERCYIAAKNRGKNVTRTGCRMGLQAEINEYWAAVDAGKQIDPDTAIIAASELSGDAFTEYYDQHIHNTEIDELADVLIVAATWTRAAMVASGKDFNPARSIDIILVSGAVQFISSRITGPAYLERLQSAVYLKMAYNETRKD